MKNNGLTLTREYGYNSDTHTLVVACSHADRNWMVTGLGKVVFKIENYRSVAMPKRLTEIDKSNIDGVMRDWFDQLFALYPYAKRVVYMADVNLGSPNDKWCPSFISEGRLFQVFPKARVYQILYSGSMNDPGFKNDVEKLLPQKYRSQIQLTSTIITQDHMKACQEIPEMLIKSRSGSEELSHLEFHSEVAEEETGSHSKLENVNMEPLEVHRADLSQLHALRRCASEKNIKETGSKYLLAKESLFKRTKSQFSIEFESPSIDSLKKEINESKNKTKVPK